MGRKVCLIVVAILLTTLGGCAFESLSSNIKPGKVYAGKTFDPSKGGALEITRKGNPTSGYTYASFVLGSSHLTPICWAKIS